MISLLIFLALISALVLAHEFGHYAFARRAGMRVEEFGIGFPPRLFGKKDAHGTLWSINLIPLGGFVRIQGEGGSEHERTLPGSFGAASWWQRWWVLLGGVLMNIFVAWVVFSLSAAIGSPTVLEGESFEQLGSSAIIEDRSVEVVEILHGSPAESAGIRVGDRITQVQGGSVSSGEETRNALAEASRSEQVHITLLTSDGVSREADLSPVFFEDIGKYGIGVAVVDAGFVRYPWYLAPIVGAQVTGGMALAMFQGVGILVKGIFTESSVMDQVSGPVGIARMTGEIAELGFRHLLQFAGILSLNLAVLNVLPFPALDGGRLVFLLLEALRRKPLSLKAEQYVHGAGFLFLLLVIFVVTYQDIGRIFSSL